jgi:hypothetical protein
MYSITRARHHPFDALAHRVSDILGGADRLGYQGVLETIGFFLLTAMMVGAFALAGLLLVHAL